MIEDPRPKLTKDNEYSTECLVTENKNPKYILALLLLLLFCLLYLFNLI